VDHFKQKGIGFLMEKELKYLKESFDRPRRPVTLILGGSKIGTKISLIQRFLNKADTIIISGGMVFTFLKAKGEEIGKSLIDENGVAIASQIIKEAKNQKAKLVFPSDFICAKNIESESIKIYSRRKIPKTMMGLDIGPRSIERFRKIISSSNTILWNGPMGVYEKDCFSKGTSSIAEKLVELTEADAGQITIVGGGDTAAAIRSYGYQRNVSHVSTGGGASLELLCGESLPAFTALG
jgi:phosphoglycerate kinase